MTGEQIKALIQEYIDANDWFSILKLMTYDICIQKEVIDDGGIPTYPSFFNNNNRNFYFGKAMQLECDIKSLMPFGNVAVYRLFNVSNSILRGYGIEWQNILLNERQRFAIDTGFSGDALDNYTREKMSAFYKVDIPECLAGQSGSAIGDPAANTVIGDPNSGIVFTS